MVDDPEQLGESLTELSALLLEEEDLQSTLERIVRVAHQVIHSCDGAGVTLLERGQVETAAGSNRELSEVDSYQYELGDGPCLESIRAQTPVRIDDMGSETRWRDFCRHAFENRLCSLIAYPLTVRGVVLGALNLYSHELSGFADQDQELGALFAAQSAVALANAALYQSALRLSDQLKEAMESRGVIEQAKGVLMEREHCSPDEAFEMLRTASQHLNRKVRDIASEIVASSQTLRLP
ncbi:MAG: ANTAR domain-containing protein [Actinomycetota bacterium]